MGWWGAGTGAANRSSATWVSDNEGGLWVTWSRVPALRGEVLECGCFTAPRMGVEVGLELGVGCERELDIWSEHTDMKEL